MKRGPKPGTPKSPETKAKMRAAVLRLWQDPAYRAKHSRAIQCAWTSMGLRVFHVRNAHVQRDVEAVVDGLLFQFKKGVCLR